jgi:hypothetical protein
MLLIECVQYATVEIAVYLTMFYVVLKQDSPSHRTGETASENTEVNMQLSVASTYVLIGTRYFREFRSLGQDIFGSFAR